MVPFAAPAQVGVRQPEKLPEVEEPGPEEPPPAFDLPPPPEPEPGRLSTGLAVFVRAFRFEGSTVFSAEELARATAPWSGRIIDSEGLLRARDAVTQLYVENGYVTSGAVIPDQSVDDGLVRIEVIEGVLAEVRVEGTRYASERFFRDRLRLAGRAPVNVDRIEGQLQRFQRSPYVERIRATLLPGDRRGESILRLTVEESRPWRLDLELSNHESPSIGSLGGEVDGSYTNLVGHHDVLSASARLTEGLRDYEGHYELPLNAWDTRLGAYFRYTEADVVEEPFDELDIVSETTTWGLDLRHPLYRSARHAVWAGIVAERRESASSLLGEPFCFQEGLGDDCESDVSALRLFQEWTLRTPRNALAARSTISLGLDVLGATTSGDASLPDGRFVAWLGQAQWVHRLPERLWGSQVVVRTDVQVSDDPLLTIEKFAVGGARTVRGYRENELVRDGGVVGSVELRVPLWREPLGRTLLEVAPFFDAGRAWDNAGGRSSETLASVGVGLRVSPWEWLVAESYWGWQLEDVLDRGDSLQDHGFHFRVTARAF